MSKINNLKNGIFILFGLFCCTHIKAQTYVRIEATGLNDGSSWENAYNDLELALDEASNGDQIWIASGTYRPGNPGDPQSTTFHVRRGIQLYGGFVGTESKLSERNTSKFPTILSADLNQDDIIDDFITNRDDNVSTIMLVENQTNTVPIIDGLTFTGGHADGNKEPYQESNGGGLFLYGAALVRNCSFSQNYSNDRGGALFLVDSLGIENADFKIDNCQFLNNHSTSGGAVNVTLLTGKVASIIIQRSSFLENTSEETGGGLCVVAAAEGANVLVDSCNFVNNFSSFTGGAIGFMYYGNGNTITTQNSTFSVNQAKVSGGAILMYSNRSSANNFYDLKNCVFKNNSTTEHYKGQAEGGGAVYIATAGENNSANIQSSDFSKNSSMGFGGALGIRNKKPGINLYAEVNNCQFIENTSDNGGGLYYEAESIKDSFLIRRCKFTGNSISELHPRQATRGGAMHIYYHSKSKESRAFVEDCIFEYNQAKDGDGGALAISPVGQGCFSMISNSSFIGNKSNGKGGAILYLGTDAAYDLKSCTFDDNQAEEGGALLYESPTLNKSLFYIFFHAVLWFQILYSLLLFLMVRERTSLYYALMLFGISLFFLVVFDGAHIPFLKELSGDTKDVLYQIGVFLSIFGLIKFAQQYLNINQLVPSFKKIVFYFLSLFLFFELVFCARQFDLLGQLGEDTKSIVAYVLLLCFAIGGLTPTAMAIIVLRKGFQPAKYFLLAMLFSGSALLWIVVSFLQTGGIGIPIISIEALLLLSIITLALADGYRVNSLKKEKVRAERLSALDIAKTRLYTNITHEFRTPLTVIMGASDQVKGNESEKKLIKRNSKQLLQLINQMLDLSKLEGGALKLETQQGNIIPFIEYLVESFQSIADVKHIRLTFYQDIEILQMDYDAVKMQQIISNLISNAVKFTATSGKVVVHAKEESFKGKPHLTVIVRDNGAGIPIKDLPHVFDRFFQVDASDSRRSEGSGIGLALVKELLHLMKGEINVTSKINEGTVFTVRIPISKVAPLQENTINLNKALLPIESSPENGVPLPFQPLADDLPLALIIEDNKDIVSFLRSCLQRSYKIEVAYNGRQGIDKALEIVPDIIISDVMMPEADGFTVCKTLKEDERTSHVPIILLTAKATQEDKVQGLDAGADAYLNKPFHQEELEVRLQKLIELRQQLQQRYQDGSNSNNSSKNNEDEFIQKLRSIIEEKMEDEEFSINELCHAVGLSRMQVHRKLKALTGMPATAFIRTVRLQKAYNLLSDTDLNVSEVAYEVGFSNHSYFTKLFVAQYGKTPSEIGNNN